MCFLRPKYSFEATFTSYDCTVHDRSRFCPVNDGLWDYG